MIRISTALLMIFVIAGCASVSLQKIREGYVQCHPNLNAKTREMILTGNIVRGMTTSEVEASWGATYQKDSYSNFLGRVEIWTYGDCLYSCDILTFDSHDKLTDISSQKHNY
jgi:hypothetical protein